MGVGGRARDRRPKSAAGLVRSRSLSRDSRSRDRAGAGGDSDSQLAAYTDDYVRGKYVPDDFAGQHVSDTLQENEQLKQQVRCAR